MNNYSKIRTLQELRHQKRILSSKIEHQESLITYKVITMKEHTSPLRLMFLGFETLASHNPAFNLILRSFYLVKSFFNK